MAEAIGVVSGLLTLISFALKASQSLYDEISSFKAQLSKITLLLGDLDALINVLKKLDERAQLSTETGKLEFVRGPLESCISTCNEMREMLDACTSNSKDGQTSVRVWLSMRFREKNFEDMKLRLSSHKSTLVVALEAVNIQDHSVTQEALSDLSDKISVAQKSVEDQLNDVKILCAEDASLRKVLEGDLARLQSSLDSLAQAQKIADTTQAGIIVEDNHNDPGGVAIWGTDTPQPNFKLTVARNTNGFGALSSAGVHSPEVIDKLFQQHQRPDPALMMEALRNNSSRMHGQALHSVINVMSVEQNQQASYASAPALLTEIEGPDCARLEHRHVSMQEK
ncbi:hypothetical protein E8E13_011396 [Curvularia kusanoi]|uniref:Azaphilone pigments biosynthesis cluster protein L N-terminal domain-containing protein n=1 Tax=Curvularia kusanoi TaxID=90978 RepID=A0A9P4TN64_CURKU|nr:hypothetical protein E8E13_011396 [Curvularia kusanoi]